MEGSKWTITRGRRHSVVKRFWLRAVVGAQEKWFLGRGITLTQFQAMAGGWSWEQIVGRADSERGVVMCNLENMDPDEQGLSMNLVQNDVRCTPPPQSCSAFLPAPSPASASLFHSLASPCVPSRFLPLPARLALSSCLRESPCLLHWMQLACLPSSISLSLSDRSEVDCLLVLVFSYRLTIILHDRRIVPGRPSPCVHSLVAVTTYHHCPLAPAPATPPHGYVDTSPVLSTAPCFYCRL